MEQEPCGESSGGGDDESTIFGMAAGLSECPLMLGDAGPADGPGTHHRARNGFVSISADDGEPAQEARLRRAPEARSF